MSKSCSADNVLSADEEEGYRQLFGQLDASMDGTISVGELVHACRLLQVRIPRPEIEDHFQRLDNGDGRVTIQEFIRFMSLATQQGAVAWNPERLQWVVSQVLTQRLLNDGEMTRRRDLIRSASSGETAVIDDVRLRWVFDTMRLVTGVYYGSIVPMHLALAGKDEWWYSNHPYLLAWECIMTVFAMVDVILGPRRHVNNAVGMLNPAKPLSPVQQYLMSRRFVIELLAGMPTDLIGYLADLSALHTTGYVLRLSGLAKFHNLFQLGGSSLVTADSARWVFELAPIVQVVIWSLLVINLASCLFIVASPCEVGNPCMALSDSQRYLEACYWALYTISSVGYGDISVDTDEARLLAIGMFLMSVVVNGYFIGKFTSLMMVDPSGEHREMMAKTRQILAQFRMPADMREDILSLQNHFLAMRLSLGSFKEVVGSLPSAVHESLSLYIRVQQLTQVPLFQNVSAQCQVALAECLRSRVVPRDEFITVQGDSAEAMYFITHGFADVLKDEKSVAVVMRGAFFGELPLLEEEALYNASTRTLTYTELLILGKSDFKEITGRFPTLKWHIELVVARKRGLPPPDFPQSQSPWFSGGPVGGVDQAIQQRLRKKRMSLRGQLLTEEIDEEDLEGFLSLGAGGDVDGPPPVRFYGFAGEWGQLCSFWPSQFECRNHSWPSIEHFFQAMKFEGTSHEDDVRLAPTPEEARARGKDRSRPLRKDWDAVKEDIMLEGLRAKFQQVSDCHDVLLRTGTRKLLFSDSADDYWGIGPAGTGMNKLGEMLMTVRRDLRKQQRTENTIRFYGFTGQWGQLTSFWPAPFELDGKRWGTLEHYFQAMKWQGTPRFDEIADAPTPDQAHNIGVERREGEVPRSDWDDVRSETMERGMLAKFQASKTCRTELMKTGQMHIVFAAPDDSYWGIGPDSRGQNMFGKLLEKVRQKLSEEDELGSRGSTVVAGFDRQASQDVSALLNATEVLDRRLQELTAAAGDNSPVREEGSPTALKRFSQAVLPQKPSQVRLDVPGEGATLKAVEVGTPGPPGASGCSGGGGSGGGPTAHQFTELMNLVLQTRETQLQQQEFIQDAVTTILGNQRMMAKKLKGPAPAAGSGGGAEIANPWTAAREKLQLGKAPAAANGEARPGLLRQRLTLAHSRRLMSHRDSVEDTPAGNPLTLAVPTA
eukprot:TRINITY_DN9539_c0_g1_i1.p1 TRINITY_DN9539_c0_g1~~TRINITY_DN9539_c0_g1_i1.p1  ORF type:complete len:1254 (+),score=241.51 TRINITY_DN9539_c0_g1_i1:261-3764(+)